MLGVVEPDKVRKHVFLVQPLWRGFVAGPFWREFHENNCFLLLSTFQFF